MRGDAYVCDPDPSVTVTSPGVVAAAPTSVTDRVFPVVWEKFSMSSVRDTPLDCPAIGVPVTAVPAPSDSACTRVTPVGDAHCPVDPRSANGRDVEDGVDVSPGVPGVPGSVGGVPPAMFTHVAGEVAGAFVAARHPAAVTAMSPVRRPAA